MKFEDLKDTFFAVEATSFEKQLLWERWHESIPMEQDGSGFGRQVGEIGGMPTMVMLYRFNIWGKWVVFYEGTSQVVDHRLVEGWIKKNVLAHTPGWDGRARGCHCDAQNFHLCVEALEEATGQKRKDIWSPKARAEIISAELTKLIEQMSRMDKKDIK